MKNICTKLFLDRSLKNGKYSIIVFLFLFATQSWAQIAVTTGSLTYNQNFNTYTGLAGSMPTGWTVACANYRGQGPGSSTTGGAWALGSGTDYSAGYVGSGTSASITYTVSFINNTGLPITKLDLGFNFEQYRAAGGNTNGFSIAGTGALTASLSALVTTSCATGCAMPATTPKSTTLTGLNIANGAAFGIQWTAVDGAGSDNSIAFDDFTMTAYNPVLTTTALAGFGNVCINTSEGPNSFTITGANLTTAAVTVGPLAGYTFSTTSGGTYSNSLSLTHVAGAYSQAIYVKLTSTAVQTYNGNIAIGGGAATAINVAATGAGVALPVVSAVSNSPLCEGSDLNLDGSGSTGNGTLNYSWNGPASYTSVSALSVISPAITTNAGNYTVLVTDANGCSATKSISVAVDRVITAPSNTYAFADAGLCTSSSVSLGTPVTSGNCTVTNITNDAPAAFSVGVTTVTWSATVGSNTFTATQTVTVTDNQNPAITAPSAVSVNSDAGICTASSVTLGTPATTDNCSVASVTNNAPATFSLGVTTVTWTVTDASGNTATATQTVTVTDNENPTITATATVSVNSDAGVCNASSVSLGTPVTSDNCSVANVTNDAPSVFNSGITTVTWTVTDGSGNTATATQTVTVTDNENPTITAPAAVSVNSDAGACTASAVTLGTPASTDNCSVANITNDAPSVFNSGVTTVTWTVTDASGNTATAAQTVTVTDNENPVITAPANVSVNSDAGVCTASSGTVALGTPVTSDNCSVANVTNDAPSVFNSGITTVTWTVTDASGNTATATQTVTITDNEDPTITAPAPISVSSDAGVCTATGVTFGTPVTSDNCAVANVSNNAPSLFNLGVTIVTWTVTDASGNTATATQTVTVTDNENPTITAPAAVSISSDAGTCTATGVTLNTPVTTDNCSVANITNDAPSVFNPGATTVTWTVTDGSGNTATATQTVTVTDNENPTITAPAAVVISADAGLCTSSTVSLGTPVASDNCLITSINNDAPALFNSGATTVTWTVMDASGNVATATQIITVNANILAEVTISSDLGATICEGTPVTFTAVPVNGGILPSYQWQLNGTNVGTNASTYSSGTLASADVISATMTSGISCASSAVSNTITMTVNDAPVITIVSNPVSAVVCTGGQLTLTANGATSYSWSGGITDGTAFVPTISDTYVVTATGTNSCTNTASIQVDVQNCTSVDQPQASRLSFNVYPNPSNGEFNISFDSEVEATVTILDLLGKVKYTGAIKDDQKQINVKDIGKGVYIIRLEKGSDEMIKLITIE